MNALQRTATKFDIQGLVDAVARNDSLDVFQPALNAAKWELLGTYLQPFAVQHGLAAGSNSQS